MAVSWARRIGNIRTPMPITNAELSSISAAPVTNNAVESLRSPERTMPAAMRLPTPYAKKPARKRTPTIRAVRRTLECGADDWRGMPRRCSTIWDRRVRARHGLERLRPARAPGPERRGTLARPGLGGPRVRWAQWRRARRRRRTRRRHADQRDQHHAQPDTPHRHPPCSEDALARSNLWASAEVHPRRRAPVPCPKPQSAGAQFGVSPP